MWFNFISIVLMESFVDREYILETTLASKSGNNCGQYPGCPEIAYDSTVVERAHYSSYDDDSDSSFSSLSSFSLSSLSLSSTQPPPPAPPKALANLPRTRGTNTEGRRV